MQDDEVIEPRKKPKHPHDWMIIGKSPDIPTRQCRYCGRISEGAYLINISRYQECKPRSDGLAPIRDRKS
jgi:hypothetical protein